MKNIKIRAGLLLALAGILGAGLITATLAWLWAGISQPHELRATNLNIYAVVYFKQADGITDGGAYRENGYYVLDTVNPSAPNYFEKLRVDIGVKGRVRAYVRAALFDMMYRTEGGTEQIPLKEDAQYILAGDWLDDRLYDNYCYYTADMGYGRGLLLNPDEGEHIYPFVQGFNGEYTGFGGGTVNVEIRAEAVPFNRVSEFWGDTAAGG